MIGSEPIHSDLAFEGCDVLCDFDNTAVYRLSIQL